MHRFKEGLKLGIPIALGYLSVSFAFGMLAIQSGLSLWQAVLVSFTNVTSAGQLAGLTLMTGGASLLEVALTQFVINVRYALMSLSLTQKLDDSMTVPRRLLFSFCNTDEVFAVASAQEGKVGHSLLLGLIVLPIVGWVSGTMLGALAGTLLPEWISACLGVALYGMFVAIVVPPAKQSRPICIVAVMAVALSCIFRYVPGLNQISGGFAIILCAVVAAGIGALLFPQKEEEAA